MMGQLSDFTDPSSGTQCSMADHIATRKSTFTSASSSRITRTHSPIVNGSQKRVGVYSNGVTYGAMSKQTQAEPCVLYIRVSTTRQANQGVSLKAQIARELNTCGVPTKRGGK